MRTVPGAILSLILLMGATGCPPAPPKEDGGGASTGSGQQSDAQSSEAAEPAGEENPPQPIRLDLTPAEGGSDLLESAKALETHLEQETGLDFDVRVPQSYNALITAMQYGHSPFGALAPFAFVKAEKQAGARVLLKSVRATGPFYYSAIVTLRKYGYKGIEDLKGKKMAFGEPLSTAGTVMPRAGLMKQGIDPDEFFSSWKNIGNHQVTMTAVINGDFDAGATFCNTPEGEGGAWAQYFPERADEFQVLWVSDPIPADTISVKDTFMDLYPQTTAKVRQAFLKLNDSADGRQMLHDLYRIEGLMEAKSEDYDSVREAASLVDIPIE